MSRASISSISYNLLVEKIGYSHSRSFVFCLLLSWVYAIFSQIKIPLPFNLVFITLNPLPLYLAALMFGGYATHAYFLYLFQGAIGLPVFAGFCGGIYELCGPTGGYLFGFGLAMIFLSTTRNVKINIPIVLRLLVAATIVYACGLAQLSLYVPQDKLLAFGFYPFIIGHLIKIGLAIFLFTKLETILAYKKETNNEII